MTPKTAAWLSGLSVYSLLLVAACLVRPVETVLPQALVLTFLALLICCAALMATLTVLAGINALHFVARYALEVRP